MNEFSFGKKSASLCASLEGLGFGRCVVQREMFFNTEEGSWQVAMTVTGQQGQALFFGLADQAEGAFNQILAAVVSALDNPEATCSP